ncbi:MAG: hypothetical protein JST16_03460 [Bdellovibrionales bacterium]|nr:hypothetical protein [Bdellovibrionales bacterium]
MKDETSLLLAAAAQEWGLEPMHALEKSDVLQFIENQVLQMLTRDRRKLLNTLYRLDISERGSSTALRLPSVQAQARSLAALILERELQKAATRRKYDTQS